jgi:tRNA(Ile)-lysidine synthase
VAAGRVGAGLTLHDCVLRRWRGRVAVRREPARVAGPAAPEAVWDGRWRRVDGEASAAHPVVVAAAGEAALAALPAWRETGCAREALAATPAVWRAGRVGMEDGLVAAPFLAPGSGWRFERVAVRTPGWVRRILR